MGNTNTTNNSNSNSDSESVLNNNNNTFLIPTTTNDSTTTTHTNDIPYQLLPSVNDIDSSDTDQLVQQSHRLESQPLINTDTTLFTQPATSNTPRANPYLQLTPTQIKHLVVQGLDIDIIFNSYQQPRINTQNNNNINSKLSIQQRPTISIYNICTIDSTSIIIQQTNNLLNISFLYNCTVPTYITVHWFCNGINDDNGNVSSIISQHSSYMSHKYMATIGHKQTFQLTPDDCIDVSSIQLHEYMHAIPNKQYFPCIIQCTPIHTQPHCIDQSYTYCTLLYNTLQQLLCKVIRVCIQYDSTTYDVSDMYGMSNDETNTHADHNSNNINSELNTHTTTSVNNECVICYSAVRSTLVLPCRHYCLCAECADTLKQQVRPRCPLCRSVVESVALIKPNLPNA